MASEGVSVATRALAPGEIGVEAVALAPGEIGVEAVALAPGEIGVEVVPLATAWFRLEAWRCWHRQTMWKFVLGLCKGGSLTTWACPTGILRTKRGWHLHPAGLLS